MTRIRANSRDNFRLRPWFNHRNPGRVRRSKKYVRDLCFLAGRPLDVRTDNIGSTFRLTGLHHVARRFGILEYISREWRSADSSDHRNNYSQDRYRSFMRDMRHLHSCVGQIRDLIARCQRLLWVITSRSFYTQPNVCFRPKAAIPASSTVTAWPNGLAHNYSNTQEA